MQNNAWSTVRHSEDDTSGTGMGTLIFRFSPFQHRYIGPAQQDPSVPVRERRTTNGALDVRIVPSPGTQVRKRNESMVKSSSINLPTRTYTSGRLGT